MQRNWTVVWDCILNSLTTVYRVMNNIKIFDLWGQNFVSLWDLCIGVIVMGAIINLFINFSTPTLPDRSSSSSVSIRTNKHGEVTGTTTKVNNRTRYR